MNNNSYICRFITDHPDDWEQLLEEKNINVKLEPGLNFAIFNYGVMADFTDPVVQEARGIIIDLDTLDVVCWPFRKFGNSHEPYADSINWSTARVQEKIDGSIIKLFYAYKEERWCYSTNSCMSALQAQAPSGRSFYDLIKMTDEFKYIDYARLDKNKTYIFELVGPENQVVIKYDKAKLYHIGTRDNITGQEFNLTIPVELNLHLTEIAKPKEYPIKTLQGCLDAVNELNNSVYPDVEGFVVVDGDWHRVKIKSPEYLIWHHAVNNGNINKESAFELLHSDDFSFDTFREHSSEYVVERLCYYASAFENAEYDASQMILKARSLKEQGLSRKEIALQIKDYPFAFYGFKSLDSELEPEQLIQSLGKVPFLKTIKDVEV